MTSPVTVAPSALASVPGSPETASTSEKTTFGASASFSSSFSTFTTSPGATRYCLPPVRITAYIQPPALPLTQARNFFKSYGMGKYLFTLALLKSSVPDEHRQQGYRQSRQTNVVYRLSCPWSIGMRPMTE